MSRRFTRAAVAASAALALALPAAIAPAQAQAPIDNLGRPAPYILDQIETASKNPAIPADVASALTAAVEFFRGSGKPGVEVPVNGPAFTQFVWPTVASQCIGGKNDAVGTAIAVPGPAPLPLPGVRAGEAGFVFTALGTGPAAAQQTATMNVHWLNTSNGKFGTTQLKPTGINADGPTTVNGTAPTGSGNIIAVLEGGVTAAEETGPSNCNFLPTVALVNVR